MVSFDIDVKEAIAILTDEVQKLYPDYKLMIAMYTDEPPVLADDRDITMWQYTAKGRIVGVNGFVDKSRFMGKHSLREIRFRH